jgi:hypothetical protein
MAPHQWPYKRLEKMEIYIEELLKRVEILEQINDDRETEKMHELRRKSGLG